MNNFSVIVCLYLLDLKHYIIYLSIKRVGGYHRFNHLTPLDLLITRLLNVFLEKFPR